MYTRREIAVTLRTAQRSDLDAINGLVEAALLASPRAKRTLPRPPGDAYQAIDLDERILLLVVGSHRHILGMAACCAADPGDLPAGQHALLLEGLYVHPQHANQGVGSQLLNEAMAMARRQGRHGLLVKTHADIDGFFQARGMAALTSANDQDDSMRRFWRAVG